MLDAPTRMSIEPKPRARLSLLTSLRSRLRGRLSIAAYLTLGLGSLTFLAVASVLVLNVAANLKNTTELLEDKSRLLLSAMVAQIEAFLDPAQRKADYVAEKLEAGHLDLREPTAIASVLETLVGDTPHIRALVYVDPSGARIFASQIAYGQIESSIGSWRGDAVATAAIREMEKRSTNRAYWGPPVYSIAGPVMNLRRPLLRQGEFAGAVVAIIQISDLSAYVAGLATEAGQNAFVLYDRDFVLAHAAMPGNLDHLGVDQPLPRLDQVGDPVLAGMWKNATSERLFAGDGHAVEVDGADYIYLYTTVREYGDAPLFVGSYFAESEVGVQFERVIRASLVGVAGLIVAVITALLFGRAIRRPIHGLASAARAIETLDLDQTPAIPRSMFRELDDAGRAFNAMTRAIRAFAVYVPRDLVRWLIARSEPTALRSEMREVTIMFTDIVGFTTLTERMGPEATAVLLNHHFDRVGACIAAEGGIVDKFLGDGVMALWGAMGDQPDHARRALLAAVAIADVIRRGQTDDMPLRLRIGIHTGAVVVGNIGSRERMNYTVIGDPVNAAARLQELGKALRPGAAMVTLVSDQTRLKGGDGLRLEPCGEICLRGRDESVTVHELIA